jgi:AcrR family transcriptional regulator
MARSKHPKVDERAPLTRARVLEGAIAIADAGGLGALTMRSLAKAFDVTPMSLYHHVANKDEILDGIIDVVFSEIELPPGDVDWRAVLRRWAI